MKTKNFTKALFYATFFLLFLGNSLAQNLQSDIDELITEAYPKDGPGISLLIALVQPP